MVFAGLQQFCNTPQIIRMDAVDKKKFPPRDVYADVGKKFKEWKKQMQETLEDNWDIAKSLKENILNKQVALQNFSQMANSMFPAMSFLPLDCLKNTLCETQRKAAGENTIKDLSDSLKNKQDAAKLLINDVTTAIEDAEKQLIQSIGNFADTAVNSVKSLADTFSIYNLCPRRFNDWLMDAGEAMGLPIGIDPFTQLQNIFTQGIIGSFKKLLGNCATDNILQNTFNVKGIGLGQKNRLMNAYKNGDMSSFKNALNGTQLKDELIDKGTGLVNMATKFNTPSFNMGKLTSLSDSMTRGLKSFNIKSGGSDIFSMLSNIRKTENSTYRSYINL